MSSGPCGGDGLSTRRVYIVVEQKNWIFLGNGIKKKWKNGFARILTDHENSARSGIRADGVREIDRVCSRIGSLCFFVDELRRDVSCIEFDSIAGEHFFAVDGPARPWLWIRRVGHGNREWFSGDDRHVANTEIRRDPRWDWKKIRNRNNNAA